MVVMSVLGSKSLFSDVKSPEAQVTSVVPVGTVDLSQRGTQ